MSFRRNAPALNCRMLQTAALMLVAAMLSPAQPTVTFTEYPVPVVGASPSITAGPDGALWIAHWDRIFRMTTTGSLGTYLVPFGQINKISAYDITVGADGALWFTGSGIAKIGRITTDGMFTEYALPGSDHSPQRITTGPDGALWFTEMIGHQGKIGRITTAGATTEFELSPCPGTCGRYPNGIAAGPDGALWFTDLGDDRIHRITTTGSVTDYGQPALGLNVAPADITIGPDGAMWFTIQGDYGANDRIGRISTTGTITTYWLSMFSNCTPRSIATGPDGALWFACQTVNMIGRITTEGQVTPFSLPPVEGGGGGQSLRDITLGPDGALWITNDGRVDRAVVQPVIVPPGDLDRDGTVDCADIAIVRASFGLHSSQPGFDPRADVNLDHIVDIRDLAWVSQKLPAGTRCQ